MSQTTWNTDRIMAHIVKAANDACYAAAQKGAEATEKTIMGGPRWTSSRPGQPPNFQRGTLAGSIHFVHPDAMGTPLTATVGTAEKHGLYMEKGAYVRAKRGKYLPVPVNLEAKQLMNKLDGRSLRASGVNLVIEKSKGGALLLVEKTKGGKEKATGGAVFILKVAVRILPRPWLRPGMLGAASQMRAAFDATFAREVAF